MVAAVAANEGPVELPGIWQISRSIQHCKFQMILKDQIPEIKEKEKKKKNLNIVEHEI